MRWPYVVGKNLKLLFRSPETAFTIIFGPLLIILLVSAAYTGGDAKEQLSVGAYSPEYTPLADQVITTIKEEGYRVSIFPDQEACLDRLRQSEVHACIFFPPDFRIKENATNNVTFAVDYSRINLAYQLIDGLGQGLEVQGAEISASLADTLLKRVAAAHVTVEDGERAAGQMSERLGIVLDDLEAAKSGLEKVDKNETQTNLYQIKGSVSGIAAKVTATKEEGRTAIESAITMLDDLRDDAENETLDEIDVTIERLRNATHRMELISEETPDAVQQVSWIVDDAAASVQRLQTRFATLANASEEAERRIGKSAEGLETMRTDVTLLKGRLAAVDEGFGQALTMSAEGIVAPITTQIMPVTAETKLTFTYPYILLLVIMFLGLMLSSSLVVMDKTSRAAFRNFTTTTRDEYQVLLGFVTTFLILFGQVCLILVVSYWFVKAPLFNNFLVSAVIIAFAITIFSFLGMIIGYLARTQQAAMIASLSLGSIFLFISNLVLPLEAMNRAVVTLAQANPYVVLSELLKQSMLFGLKLSLVPVKLGLLGATVVILFLLILFVQRSFKARYFQQRNRDLLTSAFTPEDRTIAPLTLAGKEVKDLFDLLAVLDGMTRADFETIVTEEANPIAAWVRNEVKDRSLARKLDTRSKELMILALDKHLKKKTKQLAET